MRRAQAMFPTRAEHWHGVAVWSLLIVSFVVGAGGMSYSGSYTFLADRGECDGQCMYCRHAHYQFRWSDIRTKITRYVNRMPAENNMVRWEQAAAVAQEAQDVQTFIDWSWEKGTRYECIIGIISLRLLSYGYSNPFQFNEGTDFNVLDWLDRFNSHTGALDLLTSAWAAVLGAGWPVFKQLLLVSRKLRDRLADQNLVYPALQERLNECDMLDGPEDVRYRTEVRQAHERGETVPAGTHWAALYKLSGCPVGRATALLALALDTIRTQDMYQGSLKDPHNFVYTIISAAQDAVNRFIRSKPNWSAYWDLLTSDWPIWELLSELSCTTSERSCSTRSELRCYDIVRRERVECPHALPRWQWTFAGCGEHDICTAPDEIKPQDWCVPFERRPKSPREAFLLELTHDIEERICSQCGQDGVIRVLFDQIGFRDAASASSPPFFVEFGARKPGMLNSAFIREYCHWDGILMDSQPGETPHGGCKGCPGVAEIVRTEFVTAENVNELFVKHGVPHDFDLLTIDTDYNDYWIWKALLVNGTFRPRVVAVDFNPDIPVEEAKVVRYDAFAEWDGTVYTVGSLLAYALMARAHGYAVAYALEMGSHAFFVRNDLLAESDRSLPLRSVRKSSHMTDTSGRAFVDVLYDFVPAGASAGARSGASADASASAPTSRGAAAESEELAALRRDVRELNREVDMLRALLDGERRSGGERAAGTAARSRASAPPPTPAARGHDPASGAGASRFYDGVRERRAREL